MSATTTASLTATGSVALTKKGTDTLTAIEISGTYGSVQFVIEGSVDGTNFAPLAATDLSTGLTVTSTISPSDNGVNVWMVSTVLLGQVRARVTSIGSGTVTYTLTAGAFVGTPLVNVSQAGSTITGAATFGARMLAQLLAVGPKPADTFASTMMIDVTKSLHVISASHATSATLALTPSAAGSAGDVLIILTETDSGGTVTTTFASTFHSSGTQACTLSTFSSILFISDGTRWVEVCRTTAVS